MTPIEIPEAAVQVALAAYNASRGSYDGEVPADSDDIRAALAAAVPVMFEAVGHVDRRNLARLAENKTATVWPRMYADADDVPLYALTPTPTKEASGE